jgi:gamma-glutamylcyclotransferase (GGCT)/AIG2-like uncharacterized protein YtfP
VNLFVYGSLRAGRKYHHFLEGAPLVAEQAWTRGLLYDTGWGYPAMIPGRGIVHGEIYRVDRERLKRIDHLEDFHGPGDPRNTYERVVRTVWTPVGTVSCFLYLYVDSNRLRVRGRRIRSGVWSE